MSEYINITFESGGTTIEISGDALSVNGEKVAMFFSDKAAIEAIKAIDDYGNAMFHEGEMREA